MMLELLDADSLSRLANLQLRVNAVVDGTLAGLHRRPHHGSSVEFAEHKEYSPGDELRRLDWRAYAKSDRYFIRQYEDETELKAYLLLDCSGSMGYGSPLSKLEFASVIVASLAYLLARQRDQPALLAFGDGIRSYVPPRARSGHTAALLAALGELRAEGPTGLGAAITRLSDLAAPRSLVVVVSDLFDVPEAELRLLRQLRARKHQVTLLHLLHADELTLPFDGLTMFEALEGSGQALVDPADVRKAYIERIERFVSTTAAICKEGEVAYQRVTTAQSAEAVLLDMLRRGTRGAR